MNKVPIMIIIYLIVLLGVLVGCQPKQAEDVENTLPPNTPTVLLPGSGTVTRQSATVLATISASTATSTVEATPSHTPLATKVSSAEVYIASEPEGALASIMGNDQSGQTPITLTLPTGTYTVTLSLDGYEDWTTPITVKAGSQITLTATLRQHYTVITIHEDIITAFDLRWSEDGQSLIYALADEQWPAHVQFLPVYQTWWRYDMASGDTQTMSPPQTRVTDIVRESLGVCPFALPDPQPYPCLTTLQESPTSNRIAFSSSHNVQGEANTWLANIDGSEVVYLDKILGHPEDVMWSNDSQWLLIGHYSGVNGSNLYYLVSSDGAFVENLEELTNTGHWRVQGATPQFSLDGQKVAFVGIEGNWLTAEQQDDEEAYNLYVLDLNTLEYQLVSTRFGSFQWAHDGSGIYILDGSATTPSTLADYFRLGAGVRYTDFYYIDLTQETYPEQKLASGIPLYLPYTSAWAYSPEANAIAGMFDLDGPSFSILWLK